MENENTPNLQEFLLTLAVEAVAPIVSGGATAVAGPLAGAIVGFMTTRAVDYFGPPIIRKWQHWLELQRQSTQQRAIEQMALLTPAAAYKTASTAVERFVAEANTADKGIAIKYLAAIPATARRTLVSEPVTGRLTLPSHLTPSNIHTLIQLLPLDPLPFTAPSDVPDTPYRLEELIGVGGFGAVYKASMRFEQYYPRAIKFCLNPSLVEELRHERDLLEHLRVIGDNRWSDSIVRLYGYDLEAKPPFLVYEFVPGGSLNDALLKYRQQSGREPNPDMVFGLVVQITEALASAHDQGLIHRDLKPANILVSDNKVKLTDFGVGSVIATHVTQMASRNSSASNPLTIAERISHVRGGGTPLYMSAEQRRGEPPSPQQDIYSLGVIWYQLLLGDTSRELHPGWQEELTSEIKISSEHIELIRRCVGFKKNRPENARQLLNLLSPGNKEHGNMGVATPSPVGKIRSFKGHTGRVKSLVFSRDGKYIISGSEDKTVRLWDVESGEEIYRFEGHTKQVNSVAISRLGFHLLSGSSDKTVRLWDLESKRLIRHYKNHGNEVTSVVFSSDGSRIISSTISFSGLQAITAKTIHVWDSESGREVSSFGKNVHVMSLALSPDERFALSGGAGGVFLWDLSNGAKVRQFPIRGFASTVVFSPNGRHAIAGSDDKIIRMWEVETGTEIRRFEGHDSLILCVAISPNGERILSGSRDKTIRLWDVETGSSIHRFEGHAADVRSVAFSPNGLRAISGSYDNTIALWSLPR